MIKKSAYGTLGTTSWPIYTVPDNKKAEWVMLYVTNYGGSTTTFNLVISRQGATSPLYSAYSLGAKETIKMGGGVNDFIMLPEGTQIVASAGTNNSIEIVVSLIEYDAIIQGG
jgi:hypothetical protein